MSEDDRQFYAPFTDQQIQLLFLAYLESAGTVAAITPGPQAMHLAMLAGISGAIRKAHELGILTVPSLPAATVSWHPDQLTHLDGLYRERALLIAFVASRFDAHLEPASDAEPGYSQVVVIETPAGQISWHLADADLDLFGETVFQDDTSWDGHDKETAMRRLASLR